ncbi:adenosylmethionine--8-amino-7-oxononanoate transaminase [Staphylococcus simulans]|uniref:Adenosylmethionine-8-amino-7-oxononanoate aminotransferase n=1 Tax=Staphylococcus simulans UMC-CNS-990 TaxID=1405498 RepID=A0ABN0PDG1_STASI|nr:adenosylmethionine--8-amino-7-oxononanoate transaminase [Staphylococcus simulans]ERS93674.1 adenosylmethionine--8-amino-7-oxononanoate aminotransferase [Staphylococcus simulans UMC-CNS-990]MCE5148706.1 adenosylmethionine--8-amino-7-oxononanoate transaminase [Staphylococcus simulans]PTI87211.1 adenosylmethionine--8-amino-7-oxononanoate transaminase [Staphylococcus simulans]PTJ23694.1 adenosylmethionine--8-amino-7-oxononanoate transaminase [Staphylococcus simulans]PTJ34054.1 adenosylmethionin
MNKKTLFQEDHDYVWHPFTQMGVYSESEQIIIERGNGSYLYDIDGKPYLDGYASLWVNVHGHNNEKLNRAITEQLGKIAHSTLLGSSNVPSIELAKRLVEITPSNLRKVFYSDTGSASVEIAIKMAYQYWKNIDAEKYASKKKFLTLKNSYHGDTIGAVSVGGIDTFHAIFKDLIFENIQVGCPSLFKSDYDTESELVESITKEIRHILEQQQDEICGFIVEPLIQGATGLYAQPVQFLKEVEKLCREYNILLIVDEVATGFGRTGTMFACERADVNPDIMCLAKGITGGYLPLAATLTSQAIYDAFLSNSHGKKTFFHGHTYTGNQVTCAAAIANLKLFEETKLIDHIKVTSALLNQELEALNVLSYVGNVRGYGLMYGVELVNPDQPVEPLAIPTVERIIQTCKDNGLMIRNLENVITFVPVLNMSEHEIKKMIDIFKNALNQVM